MRSALLVLLASCSAPASGDPAPAPTAPPPAPKPTPVAAPPADLAPTPAATVAWAPHHCVRSAWPYYDSSLEQGPHPPPTPPPVGDPSEGYGGTTLDAKAAELAKHRKDAGVCDTRHRGDLEGALAKRAPAKPAASPGDGWDRTSRLANIDRVRATLALTSAEEKQLATTGFVVPDRLSYDNYTSAYYDVHRSELPVYVSVDSIMHAVFVSHDQLLLGVEQRSLVSHLDALLGAMHCGLPAAAKQYPPDVANDLDLYLTVARSLLAGTHVPSELGKVDAEVEAIVGMIEYPDGLHTVDMFGRTRAFDATQFTPRGHYTDYDMPRYFRAAMWASRVEFNLVSRDSRSSQPGYIPDRTETPREAVVALALADLVERTHGGGHLAALDSAWSVLAGAREDVSLPELGTLRAKASIASLNDKDAAAKLRAAIGTTHRRTVNVHPMPNVANLPVIATLLGPRVAPDTSALGALTDGRGPDFKPVELGFVLGQDRAAAYVDPADQQRLRDVRAQLAAAPDTKDLYSAWLRAIRSLAVKPEGAQPSYADTPAYADLRLASALVSYGQLRHDHVLVSAHVYDQGGCEIPDGYVEPAVATYQALADYARRGKQAAQKLDPEDASHAAKQFTQLERLMATLVAISREELANHPLSTEAKQFLAMIVERREATAWGYNGTFPVATWDGWYIDLFPNIDMSFKSAAFVADLATYNRNGQTGIHYLGAHGPRLGVFVIDTGGEPRVMVGPVATGLQHTGPLATILTDGEAEATPVEAPWARSYSVGAPPVPQLALEFQRALPPDPNDKNPDPTSHRAGHWRDPHQDALPEDTVRITAPKDLGTVTLELLDHHFQRLAQLEVTVRKGRTDVKVAAQHAPVEAIRVVAGGASARVDLGLDGYGTADFAK